MEDRPFNSSHQTTDSSYLLSLSLVLFESEMDNLVGFRFLPTKEEIVYLLKKKRSDPDFSVHTIKEVNIYSCEPWELQWHSEIQCEQLVWFFFCEPYYKYAKSKRAHRRTIAGYWKITGTGSNIKAKNSNDVIGSKKILTFYYNGLASKEGKSEWVMHEFHIKENPLYKKDFVVCRIKRKRDNKHGISTSDEGQSSQQFITNSRKYVTESIFLNSALPPSQILASTRTYSAENIFSENQLHSCDKLISDARKDVTQNAILDSQLLSTDLLISNSGNHGAENDFLDLQLLPDHNMISHSKIHDAKTASPELQLVSSHNSISYGNDDAKNDSPESQLLPDHNVISPSKIHFAENTSAESQLLPSHNSISNRNDVANNHSPELLLNQNWKLEHLSNQCFVSYPISHAPENTFQAESPLLPEFNVLDGYSGLNNASFSLKQSQIYPQQDSPYSSSSSNSCGFLNSEFYVEQVDGLINSPRAFQNEYTSEETGQTHIPDFSSSKSDGGVYMEDISDTDTETFNAWVNQLFVT